MDLGVVFGVAVALVAVVGAILAALYAMGFFQYLGGKNMRPDAVSWGEMFNRLVSANDPNLPFQIREGDDTDLVVEWKLADANWFGIFSANRLAKWYKMYLSLDDSKKTVRAMDELGSISWSIGVDGSLRPRVSAQASFFRGRILFKKEAAVGYGIRPDMTPGKAYGYYLDTDRVKGLVKGIVQGGNWEFVEVTSKKYVIKSESLPPPPPA